MRRVASMPSMPGIFQSMSTSSKGASGGAPSSFSMASCPEVAVSGAQPMLFRASDRISRDVRLSSTTRTRMPRKSSASCLDWCLALACRPIRAVNQKVLPWPGSLSTPISPPMSSARRLLMARPRPVPPNLRVVDVSAWVKDWKSLPRCSAVRPMPVSVTLKRTRAASSPFSTRPAAMTISPFWVNLTALPARLSRICPRRRGSPTRFTGTSGSMRKSSSRPFSSTLTVSRLARLSMTSSRWNSVFSMSSLPASILEKSRMSLMMRSSALAELSILVR